MEESLSEFRKIMTLDQNRFAPGPTGCAAQLTPTSKYISLEISLKGVKCFELFECILKECIEELRNIDIPQKGITPSSRALVTFAYAIAALRTTSLSTGNPLPISILPILLGLPEWVLAATLNMVDCCIMFSTQVGFCLRLDNFVSSMLSQSLITIEADNEFARLWQESNCEHERESDSIRPMWSRAIGNNERAVLSRSYLLQISDISEVNEGWSDRVRSEVKCDEVEEDCILSGVNIILSRAQFVLLLFKAPV